MAGYSLADHVFVCVNDEHVVVLDLKQDRYWALEASQTQALAGLVPGWPVQATHRPDEGPCDPGEARQVAELLIEQGILCAPGNRGKDATPVQASAPLRELLCADEFRSAPVGCGVLVNFLAASLGAKLTLRRGPFERVIREFRARKAMQSKGSSAIDLERARRLVESFFRLRVFFFSSHNECLFDSLALLGFLARYGIYADWVFGVQARPFAAHCWVQQDDVVLNDTLEHIGGYTPIMAV